MTNNNTAATRTHGTLKNLILTAFFSAMCLVLPMAFHAVPKGGLIFCPMHIPVLLCAFACGWSYALATAAIGPTISFLATSMPDAATLPSMIIELAVYALTIGFLMKVVRTGSAYADMYIALVTAMILGRVVGGIVKALFFVKDYTIAAWATAYFATGLPGIILHLALVPNVIFALTKMHLLPERYPKEAATDVESDKNN